MVGSIQALAADAATAAVSLYVAVALAQLKTSEPKNEGVFERRGSVKSESVCQREEHLKFPECSQRQLHPSSVLQSWLKIGYREFQPNQPNSFARLYFQYNWIAECAARDLPVMGYAGD